MARAVRRACGCGARGRHRRGCEELLGKPRGASARIAAMVGEHPEWCTCPAHPPPLSRAIADQVRELPDRRILELLHRHLAEVLGLDQVEDTGPGDELVDAVVIEARTFPRPRRRAALVRLWRERRYQRRRRRVLWTPASLGTAPPVELEHLGPLEDDVRRLDVAVDDDPPVEALVMPARAETREAEIEQLRGEQETEHWAETAFSGGPTVVPDLVPLEVASPRRAPIWTPAPPVRKALAAPLAAPLQRLPIAEIAVEGDTFACRPLSTVLSAGSCVRRQHAADPEARKGMRPGDRVALGSLAAYGTCRDCGDGKAVAARLGRSAA